MKLADVIRTLDAEGDAALAVWCDREVQARSTEPHFADTYAGLCGRYGAELLISPGLWSVNALVAATWLRAYRWWDHLETPGPSTAANAAQAEAVRAVWEWLATQQGSSLAGAQVVATLAPGWKAPSGPATTAQNWAELVTLAETLAR